MSADRPELLERLRGRLGLTFPVLHDSGLAVADAYGVRENVHDASSDRRQVPVPSTFLIGPDGRVCWRYVGRTAYDRPAPSDVLAALAQCRPAATDPSDRLR